MPKIKEAWYKPRVYVHVSLNLLAEVWVQSCVTLSPSLSLCFTHPQTTPPALITMRKSVHGYGALLLGSSTIIYIHIQTVMSLHIASAKHRKTSASDSLLVLVWLLIGWKVTHVFKSILKHSRWKNNITFQRLITKTSCLVFSELIWCMLYFVDLCFKLFFQCSWGKENAEVSNAQQQWQQVFWLLFVRCKLLVSLHHQCLVFTWKPDWVLVIRTQVTCIIYHLV